MTLPTLAIYIDWNADGDFGEADENVTADVIALTYRRGASFDGSSEAAGNCTLTVRNDDGRYSPDNAAGPYYGDLKLGRSVWVLATYSGTPYAVFYGHIQRITPLVDKTAQLYAEDWLSLFALAETNVPFSATRSIRDYRDLILDDMGIASGQRNLAYGIENDIPATYADRQSGLAALDEVNAAAGSIHYVAPSTSGGVFARYTTIDRGALLGMASSEAWNDEYIVGLDGYDINDEAIVNEMRAGPVQYDLEATATIWSHPGLPFTVAPSATMTIWADFSAPVTSGSTTYTATNTPGVSTTFFGASAKIVITAGVSGSTVSELYLEGRSYVQLDTETVLVQDATSKATYFTRQASEVTSHLLPSRAAASGLAEWKVLRYKDPKPRPRLTKQDHYPSILARDVGQVITLTFGRLSISARRYFIRALEGEVDAREGTWLVTYDLEEALALDTWFTLDTAGKGLDNGKLGY